ncbi:MAG: ArdC-like ssDNA-binding domain-containing protein, partial [Acidimicrobiales bacterium]
MRGDHGSGMEAAQARLVAGVAEITSGEDWATMLAVSAKFHSYSTNNVILLMVQAAERGWDPLTMGPVAGYRTWQSLGRQVRRGEHALMVLAPVVARVRKPDPGDDADQPRRLLGFKAVHVFCQDQTDGPALPEGGPRPTLLKGAAPPGVFEALAAQVERAGFSLSVAPLSPANGVTDYSDRRVTLADRLGPAQAIKTLAHELAHVLLHDPQSGSRPDPWSRERAEVEAESVAYLVGDSVGLDSRIYTFPYVARWSAGDPEVARSSAERAMATARRVVEAMD